MTTPNPTQIILNNFVGKPVHIFGVSGAEGSAVLAWAVAHELTHIIAHDVSPRESLMNEWHRVHEGASEDEATKFEQLLSHQSVTLLTAADYETPPGEHDIIFVPQSWFRYPRNNFLRPLFSSTLEVLPQHISRVWTLTRLYFEIFPGKILAVTGSDGKTTTTRLLGSMMARHAETLGVTCIETGNDRMHLQALEQVELATPQDFLVLEISDRQLSFGFPLAPDVAVVTNVTPNKHMDDYGGFEQYALVKSHLLAFQRADQTAVLCGNDAVSREMLLDVGEAKKIIIDPNAPDQIISPTDLKIFGAHNYVNALCAAAAARAAGMPDAEIMSALKEFQPVPHRLQPVGAWHGIMFVEDSAGGNPVNIAAAIKTFVAHNLVLCVGGYRPHVTALEVADMLAALQEARHIHTLLLFGQVRHELAALVLEATRGSIQVVMCEGLAEVFEWVKEHANALATLPAPVVCMTPGFESFDQYKDYRARAAHFVTLVNTLC